MSDPTLNIDLRDFGRKSLALIEAALEAAVALETATGALGVLEDEHRWLRESFRMVLDSQRSAKLEAAWHVLDQARFGDADWLWNLLDEACKAVPAIDAMSLTDALDILGIVAPPEALVHDRPPEGAAEASDPDADGATP
ncbi:MAG: hypothetical protein JW990_00185 [Thermoleophilia bacterium]|nr:hypothetical protein [Thermoleophilia bacterium]